MGEDASNTIRPGATYEKFDVLEEIGKGSFAIVYRAYDPVLERHVALKVLEPDREGRERAHPDDDLREARMVVRISDPNVVTLYSAFQLPDDRWVFELEYCEGGSLAQRLQNEGALPPAEAGRILEAILRGLDAAHRHGIVHHDIKPGNVLLSADGRVMLADFGLGRFVAEEDLKRGARGTLPYMAPEVVMGHAGEEASDLWSVGVVLYRMLSGRLPFPARLPELLFSAIQNATPAPLPDSTPALLGGIALRCLAKDPAARPASAGALLEELQRHGRSYGGITVDPAVAGGRSLPLAGREGELSTLRGHLDQTAEGEGSAVLVLGEAGIGKTALMQEFGREARIQGFRWVEVRLSPLEGLRRPLAQALQQTVSTSSELSAPSEGSSTSSHGIEILRRLREDDSSLLELPLQSAWEMEQALVALAEAQPVALAIEDVHHCDTDELKLLASLATALRPAPVLLAMTYRTRDPAGSDSAEGAAAGYYDLSSAPDVERLELEPLGDRAIRALLEQEAGVPVLPLELVERVIRDSEGVPLYALDLYRHLEASGEVERHEDAVRITKRWGRTDLPRALRDMVRRRLTGVGEEERALLETAAVAGVEFDGGWLAEVMGLPLLGVLRTLQRLFRERALVQPLKHGYRFGHAIYQEVIYREIAPDLRRALHGAWAEVLAAKPVDDGVDPEVLGWHWEQAGESDKAAGPLRLATSAAAVRSEHARAWRLAERAGILDPDAPPDQVRRDFKILVGLASTFSSAEDAERSERLYDRLLQVATTLDDAHMRRRVVLARSWHDVQHSRGTPIDLEALEDAARHLGPHEGQANAWWLLGRVHAGAGDFARARDALHRADRIHRELKPSAEGAHPALHTLGAIQREECDFEGARATYDQLAASMLRTDGQTPQAALARAQAILSDFQAGRADGAAGDALEEPIRWLELAEQTPRAAQTMALQAQIFDAAGRTADAWASMRQAEPILRDAVLAAALQLLLRLKARRQIGSGDLEAADATLADAIAAGSGLPPIDRAAVDEQRAFLAFVRGEEEEASRLLMAALEQVAPTVHRNDLSRLLVEMLHLAALGLDLSDALPIVQQLAKEDAQPPAIDLALRIASVLFRTDLGELDAPALERAAAAARDPRIAWQQATMGAVASLLSAQAHLLRGESEAASSLLREARQRAQHLDHVWLELRTLQLARDADFDVDPFRVRALVDRLKERNPTDTGRAAGVIIAWTSGMPRA